MVIGLRHDPQMEHAKLVGYPWKDPTHEKTYQEAAENEGDPHFPVNVVLNFSRHF